MTDRQFYMIMILPIAFNMFGMILLYTLLNSRINAGFAAVNTRFDDMKDMWRAELRRVEEVFDARLKHMEEKVH